MAMEQSSRRQVLQLDDVSSSHQPRHHPIQPGQIEDNRNGSSNPLLSLVGQYNSDSSSDEENNDDKTDEEIEDTIPKVSEKKVELEEDTDVAVDGKAQVIEEEKKDAEIPLPMDVEPPVPDTLLEIPLPAPSVGVSVPPQPSGEVVSSIDSEVASFLAEIESISKEQEPHTDDKKVDDQPEAVDSSQSTPVDLGFIPKPTPVDIGFIPKPTPVDIGFIPKPEASIATTEELRESKPIIVVKEEKTIKKEKRSKPSSSHAYKSMFVKGAVEFVKKEKDEEKTDKVLEMEEELPEEPKSEWQMVQDETTQYFYYWNMVNNQVTWEIPPGYTQFLLRYKEYEERIAKIPKDKLQRMKERKEQKKKQGSEKKRESSPAPSSSETKHRPKHKKEKRRKETSEAVSSNVPIGPQLPPPRTETAHGDVKIKVEKVEDNDVCESGVASPSKKNAEETKTSGVLESAVDSTSVETLDLEAIFSEAFAAVAKGSKEVSSSQAAVPVTTSASPVDSSAPVSSLDFVKSAAVPVDSAVDSSKPVSPVPMDSDSTSTATAAVVSSSSVVTAPEKEVKDTGGENSEAVVTNSGVNDDAANDDDDDFDMDFDDIDDLDRALEKALEKKLEKKKAELENLEKTSPQSPADSAALPSASHTEPSQSETAKPPAAKPVSPSEVESAVSSSMKTAPEPSVSGTQTHKKSPVSSVSTSVNGDREKPGTSGIRSKKSSKSKSKSKRSAVESSTKDEHEKQEPNGKKARLVSYDTQTDDESMDTSDEVSTTPVKAAKQPSNEADSDIPIDILPTPPPEKADNLVRPDGEIQEMADTAFAKLAFLDVTSDGLSPLQISLVQLQTRLTDWQEGGLIGEYFYQRLREVNSVLKQYESSAVPTGWTCQWDSNFRRYFYTNSHTGESQWDYPDGEAVDSAASTSRKSKKGKGSKRKKAKVTDPEPAGVSISEAASLVLAEAGGSVMAEGRVVETEEDLDGVAMGDEAAGGVESRKPRNGNSAESQPSTSATSTTATTPAIPESDGDSFQAALQSLFPGEPLPPGTELLLGLPPPPPPPLPAEETPTTTDDAYVCAEDSSDESVGKDEKQGEEKAEVPKIDPDIDGEELVEEEGAEKKRKVEEKRKAEEEEEVVEETVEVVPVVEDPAVISRPPQLRFPVAAVSSSSSASAYASSSSTVSAPHVRSAAPVLHAPAVAQPDSASSLIAAPALVAASSPRPSSPKVEDGVKSAGSPAPVGEASSSSTTDHPHKHDKHKKKKKEKLGSHTMSLKKKGVSSLVQKWQKVKKEVEQEEHANEKRQQAIRQQLEEWKKENS
ncbi:formin-binding protein 4-like isoform X2 [Littorina saxatilis]|uniref:formin-binding protein 4-like isoform X2 n=1 Tax=Littorina saxatilis TaxID=31220 RepID=UPI0038B4B13C